MTAHQHLSFVSGEAVCLIVNYLLPLPPLELHEELLLAGWDFGAGEQLLPPFELPEEVFFEG